MKTVLYISFITIIATAFIGCKKDPVVGPQGATGADGNANVKRYTITALTTDWTFFGTLGNPGYGCLVAWSLPTITQNILDNGEVSIYYDLGGSYTLLPLTLYFTGYSVTYSPVHMLGLAQVERYDSDLLTVAPSTTINFKVLVIAGTAGKRNLLDGVDRNDYNAVCLRLGLEP